MKIRLSVARCCCASYCDTAHEESFSDDFSSLDPDWTFTPAIAGAVTGGKLRLTSQFGNNIVTASRTFKFDPVARTKITQEVELDAWANSGTQAGLWLFQLTGNHACQFSADVNAGDFYYIVSDGSSSTTTRIAQTPAAGDVLRMELTLTSWTEGTTTTVFDTEYFINGVSKATDTLTRIQDPCSVGHGLVFADVGFPFSGDTADFDDYDFAVT